MGKYSSNVLNFFEFIKPWCEPPPGCKFIGYYRHEDDEVPTFVVI